MMRGSLKVVSNADELKKEITGQFSLRYQILNGDQVIEDKELNGEKVLMRPGDYLVKITSNPAFKDQLISLQHGQKISYRLTPKGDSAVLVKVE